MIGPVYVGRKNGDPKPSIVLGGVGIRNNHAIFQQKDDGFIYLMATEPEALEHILVNGQKLEEQPETGVSEQRLFHLDRIVFGINTIFLFKYPLIKRKLAALTQKLREEFFKLPEEELEKKAKA